jgi:hypothetical protein
MINSEMDNYNCHTNIIGHSFFVESHSILNTQNACGEKVMQNGTNNSSQRARSLGAHFQPNEFSSRV